MWCTQTLKIYDFIFLRNLFWISSLFILIEPNKIFDRDSQVSVNSLQGTTQKCRMYNLIIICIFLCIYIFVYRRNNIFFSIIILVDISFYFLFYWFRLRKEEKKCKTDREERRQFYGNTNASYTTACVLKRTQEYFRQHGGINENKMWIKIRSYKIINLQHFFFNFCLGNGNYLRISFISCICFS